MPIYEYECSTCNKIIEQYNNINKRHESPICCDKHTNLLISKPANPYVSGYPYYDPVLEVEVSDPTHRKKLLKQHNLIERG